MDVVILIISKKLPWDMYLYFEGGNQNRVIKNNKTIIDSGVIDFKFNKDYIVFSVDTTFSNKQNKEVLLYSRYKERPSI